MLQKHQCISYTLSSLQSWLKHLIAGNNELTLEIKTAIVNNIYD